MIKPIRANIEITNKCNLRCKHCYLFSRKNISLGLAEDKIISIIKRIISEGILEISIGGGEPFCFRLLRELLTLCTKSCYTVVTTNGTLIKPEDIIFMSRLNNFALQISLDGSSKIHRYIRNISNSQYKKLIYNIQKCKSRIDLQIGFMLSKMNIDDIEYIINFCQKNNIVRLTILPYIGKDKKFRLNKKDRQKASNLIKRHLNKEVNIYIRNPEMMNEVFGTKSICEAGKSTFNIDYLGNVSACCYFESPLGKISETKISEIPIIFKNKYSTNAKNRTKCLAI